MATLRLIITLDLNNVLSVICFLPPYYRSDVGLYLPWGELYVFLRTVAGGQGLVSLSTVFSTVQLTDTHHSGLFEDN